MADSSWWPLLASSVGGGFVVKLFDYLHDEIRRYREQTHTAKDLLLQHHDPILKAADELVGEMRSLAISDFRDFRAVGDQQLVEVRALRQSAAIFYVVQFWSRLQLLKQETGYTALAAGPEGPRLHRFIQHLESRAVRIVDRTWQRAAGEAILIGDSGARRPMNLYEFTDRYQSNEEFRAWFAPLSQLFDSTAKDKSSRQRLLKYGVVLHALIDTQDPKHVVTTRRDPWPHKLSNAVRKELRYGTFGEHLPFVTAERYLSAPKKGGPSGLADGPRSEHTAPIGPAKIGS